MPSSIGLQFNCVCDKTLQKGSQISNVNSILLLGVGVLFVVGVRVAVLLLTLN